MSWMRAKSGAWKGRVLSAAKGLSGLRAAVWAEAEMAMTAAAVAEDIRDKAFLFNGVTCTSQRRLGWIIRVLVRGAQADAGGGVLGETV